MRVAEVIIGWQDGGPGSLSARLAKAVEAAIERGALRSGVRLPPERDLAHELIVSRGTVTAAYRVLREKGLVETRERGRTAVLGSGRYRAFASRLMDEGEPGSGPMSRSLIDPPGRAIDFATSISLPQAGLGAVAQRLFAGFDEHPISRMAYVPTGLPSLRERIAEVYARSGCPTTAGNILVTSGATQALSLVLAMTVEPGDTVLCEDPSYPGAVDLLRASFARTHSIPLDAEGLSLDELRRFTDRGSPTLLFFSPSFNSPTGRLTSLKRRRDVAELCAHAGMTVVEDTSLIELALTDGLLDGIPASLSAFDADAPFFSIGSVDKSVWTGLRVGWVRGPARYMRRLAEIKTYSDMTTSLLSQWLAEQFIDDGQAFAQRRRLMAERLDVLRDALATHLPDWPFQRPDGGQVLWVDTGMRATRFAHAAEACGVRVGCGPEFSVSQSWENHLRLAFGQHEPEAIREGVRRLATARETVLERSTRAG